MKLITNILSDDVIKQAYGEVEDARHRSVWQVSNIAWDRTLTDVISPGPCTFTAVGEVLHRMVVDHIRPHIPHYNRITIRHYLWHPLSGINMHSDGGYKFGATIYLNPNWDMRWGGLLVVKEDGRYVTYPPVFNSLILNDSKQDHMVTTVSPHAPYLRHTLQIWGE